MLANRKKSQDLSAKSVGFFDLDGSGDAGGAGEDGDKNMENEEPGENQYVNDQAEQGHPRVPA